MEESRIAVLAIAVKDREKAMQVNEILHNYGEHIISRNGIPKTKSINILRLSQTLAKWPLKNYSFITYV